MMFLLEKATKYRPENGWRPQVAFAEFSKLPLEKFHRRSPYFSRSVWLAAEEKLALQMFTTAYR